MPTGDLIPEPTADGSLTFFSTDFGESFHSRAGARTEAEQTYVQATHLRSLAHRPVVRLLDVCHGLGYNAAAALEALWQVNPRCRVELVALELDRRVLPEALPHHRTQGWTLPVLQALESLAAGGAAESPTLSARLLLEDARQSIQTLGSWRADAIFLDPFSPPHCPQLWTVEFLQAVASHLDGDGMLATYSAAAAVRTALQLAGLTIGPTAAIGRRWPGTAAVWPPRSLPPLSQQEQEHLQTRAAVPYRDPTLSDGAAAISQRRQQEQAVSSLQPTGQWRRRWL